MMNSDICRYQVVCLQCRMHIDLPHQSPLGKFKGSEKQPLGNWPTTFLCRCCGRSFMAFAEDIFDCVRPTFANLPTQGLLRIEYEHDPEPYRIRAVAYTPCGGTSPDQADIRRAYQFVQEHSEGSLLSLTTFPS